MNNVNLEVDTKQLLQKFASLKSKEQAKTYKMAIKKSLQSLVKETKSNLKKDMGKVVNKKDKYGATLNSGIKSKVYKDASGGNVTILSNFKLKFFELGTKIRKTKKGYNRGKIKAIYFFKNARQKMENKMTQILDSNIATSILKIWNKK